MTATQSPQTVYMIIATVFIPQSSGCLTNLGEVPSSRSLVGVATDLENAELLITEDYFDLLKTNKLSATKYPLNRQTPYLFKIENCSWELIETPVNEVVNFTLD